MSLIFILSVLLVLYTYAGYPLVIKLLAKYRPRRVDKTDYTPKVTLVVCVHNEAQRIAKKIENSLASNYPEALLDVLVVSDGSTDETTNIVSGFGARVRLLAFEQQRGKAACLSDALDAVNAEITVLTDARQDFEPQAIRELVANFVDEKVGAVSGELCFYQDGSSEFSQGIDAYWRYEKMIRKAESDFDSAVGVTGAIYALRTKLYRPIPPQTVLDDVLIPMQVVLQGYRVLFEPAAIAYDIPSADPVREKKRKVRTLAGNYQLLALEPELLKLGKNRLIWQFVSHKLLRLWVPFFLLFAFISNIYCLQQGWFFKLAMIGQVIFYCAAVLVQLNPELAKVTPLKLVRTFVSLNHYALLGLKEYWFNKNIHIWK